MNDKTQALITMTPGGAITPEYLRECFDYDLETGVLTWKVRPESHFKNARARNCWNARYAMNISGESGKSRYLRATILGKQVCLHRILWALAFGSWPTNEIDHIDNNPKNNSMDNLREATHSQNGKNQKKPVNNTSGYKGVSWSEWHDKYAAKIKSEGKWNHLGYFDDPQTAHAAYCQAANRLHGSFANHGTTREA